VFRLRVSPRLLSIFELRRSAVFEKEKGHSRILRTSPGRSASDLRLSVSRNFVSVATWPAGITIATAATAFSGVAAAAQSDLLPSGAVTSTTGILVLTFAILECCAAFLVRLSISAL
jgi:hypothetical protein